MSHALTRSAIAGHIAAALALMSSHPAAQAQSAGNLLAAAAPTVAASAAGAASPSQTLVVSNRPADTPAPTDAAPSQGSLAARSAQSIVSDAYIRDFLIPTADYTQVLSTTPGVFSYSPNGVGLGDSKVTMRGMSDSNAVISFDGIPFNDTNGVSHHSWTFFPTQFLGGAVVDRSPGSAATIGQATFAGAIDLKSRVLGNTARTGVSVSAGTWNTHMVTLETETGNIGRDGRTRLMLDAQDLKSDGYQTFNNQHRKAVSAKLETALTDSTTVTAFTSYLDLKNHTPNIKGISRTQYEAGDYRTLLSGDPAKANYYGYNFYDVYTDFSYLGLHTDLGNGWEVDDKYYVYQYHNKQNYNSATTISASSGTDKLNAYTTKGAVVRVTGQTAEGVLRAGFWLDRADSNRYQIAADPRTWVDRPSVNFRELYVTTTLQPYAEYEWHATETLALTAGMKYASYEQAFTHFQDNGGAVGTLGGSYNKTTGVITGGQPLDTNQITYTDTLPSADVHWQITPDWSAYAQYAFGDQIPPTSVFDVANARVLTAPQPTKSRTRQVGTVWNGKSLTLAADVYRTALDGTYTSTLDANQNVVYYASGRQIAQGVEAEGTVTLGAGFSLYANATLGSVKYDAGKQWVAGAPKDTETLTLNYRRGAWAGNFSLARVGRMYADGKDGSHQDYVIQPVTVANLAADCRLGELVPALSRTRLQLAVNNVFDRHSITGIASPAGQAPAAGDLLTVLPARSVTLTASVEF